MATRLRLVLLVLALAYSAAFGPGGALAAQRFIITSTNQIKPSVLAAFSA